MADGSIDILMRVVDGSNRVLRGEARTQFGTGADPLRYNFAPGFFCELRQFSFNAGVESGLVKQSSIIKQQEKEAAQLREQARRSQMTEDQRKQEDDQRRMDARDQRAKLLEAQAKKARSRGKGEFVDMQPVEFSRVMDRSSVELFTALTKSETLSSISVVKRKASGGAASGLCYLRMDFTQVLLTDLAWKDEHHVMVETGSFIYRALKISYAPQKPDGSLKSAITADWAMKTKR